MELRKKKKGGSFFGALIFLMFFLVLIIAGALGAAYVLRDQIITEYIRREGPRALGVEALSIESLVTRPLGQVSVEIQGLVFQSSKQAPTLHAQKVVLSSPHNLFELYQLTMTHGTLPLKAQLVGVQIQATTNGTPPESPTETDTKTTLNAKALPFGLDLEAELRDASLELGPASKPVRVRDMTGIVRIQVTSAAGRDTLKVTCTGQLALGFVLGDQSHLPLRTEWSLFATPKLSDPSNVSIQINSLHVSTLGMTLKSKGTLKWPEQTFSAEASGSTPDLGVLPLDQAESQALGLSGRLKGQAEVSVQIAGALDGVVNAQGSVRVKGGQLPFALTREQPRATSVKGPVDVDLEAPFKISYDIANSKIKSLDLQLATFRVDLSGADVRIAGLLRKPPGLMMAASGNVTAEGETIELGGLDLKLANAVLSTKGQVSIDPKRHSKLDFALTLPNLNGWPQLAPVLGTLDGGAIANPDDLNRAKGSFNLKAKAEIPLGAPATISTDSKFDVEVFEATGLEFPVNIQNEAEKRVVNGVVRGSVFGSGTFALTSQKEKPVVWNLKRATGMVDLKDLAVSWGNPTGELVSKSRGQDAGFNFGISSVPGADTKIKVERLDLRFVDSTASLTGFVTHDASGDILLDTSLSMRAALRQVYDLLPAMRPIRAKFPSGTIVGNVKAVGTYHTKEGHASSPLVLNGRIGLKAPQAIFLEANPVDLKAKADSKTKTPSEPASAKNGTPDLAFLKWPIVAKSKMVFDVQIDAISVKTTSLKGVGALATLTDGNLTGNAAVANAFGGPIKISQFSMPSLARARPEEMKATITGNFQGLNLSAAGEYMNPQWKTLVGGLAGGAFTLSILPFSGASAVDTAAAQGSLQVKQGFLSTISLDQMVNQKLMEHPEISKLAGVRPKVASKGVSLNLGTDFSFAKGRLNLRGLKALSPERNELRLDGWLQKDFTADLTGTAALADAQIGGSFRQANSDKQGRLVVPIHISGSLKEPSVSIAQEAINEMMKKTIQLEANKLKGAVKANAGRAFEQKKKEAIDAVKEELKKRGLGF